MPQAATHAYASSESHASRQPQPKAGGGAGEPTDFVERLLASPPATGNAELRNEVELLRRVLGEQQRALRRSFASAAQFEKDALAAAVEAGKLREAIQKLERDLQGEKVAHARESSRTGEQIAALNKAVSDAAALDLVVRQERRRERRCWIAASAVAATSALALAVALGMLPRPLKDAARLPKPRPTAAGASDTAHPTDTAHELGRVRQALSVLPADAVRRILRDEPQDGPPPGCAVDPREGRMLLRVGKDGAGTALASALASCVEKLEAPLK